jgi:hypothetical protein
VFIIQTNVAYWRKANQIHGWFVDQCGNGEDRGEPYFVPRDKLVELHDLCVDLMKAKDPSRAEKVLPSRRGFFFGPTDYDECYWQDIELTVTQLHRILTDPRLKDCYFLYQASW